jgi:carbon-monoxide dehydrogenase small subunit
MGVGGAAPVVGDGPPVPACRTPAARCALRATPTIVGLWRPPIPAGGTGPDPIQAAFDRCGALQCGFCQPGMLLSARALLDANPRPTRTDIRAALAGNLGRCTGYTQIVQAVELAIAEATGTEPESPAWAPGTNPWKRPEKQPVREPDSGAPY